MALTDYTPARDEVQFKGGSFGVRGLSLEDFAVIMQGFTTDLNVVIGLYFDAADKATQSEAVLAQYAMDLVREAPGMVSQIIALGADEPDQVDRIRSMGMSLQLDALMKIVKLTFEEAGGPKKLFESLSGLIRMVAPNLKQTGSLI